MAAGLGHGAGVRLLLILEEHAPRAGHQNSEAVIWVVWADANGHVASA